LLLDDNPSLRREAPALVEGMFRRFAQFPVDEMIHRGKLEKPLRDEILARPYTAEQALGGWFPDGPT
jgi:hypothetical protein